MGENEQIFFYQNYILLFFLGGGIALLYSLLHRGKKRWIASCLLLLCVATIVWYFTPFSIRFSQDNLDEVILIYGGTEIEVDEEQAQHLALLCNDLIYFRRIGQHKLVRSGQEYAYLRVRDDENEVNLELAIGKNGFSRYPGLYGVTYGADCVKETGILINYIKTIVPKEIVNQIDVWLDATYGEGVG